jgi:hypothetical protein
MMLQMTNAEFVQILNRCKREILHLRAAIAHLEPKADAYDNLACVLRLMAQPSSIGMLGEDVVRFLDERVNELEKS